MENEHTERGKLVKVPSLRRRPSDKKTTHRRLLDPKIIQQSPSVSSASTLKVPIDTPNSEEVSLGEDLTLAASSEIGTAPAPAPTPNLQDSAVASQNSLLPPLSHNAKLQQTVNDLLQPAANDFVPQNAGNFSNRLSNEQMNDGKTGPVSSKGALDVSAVLHSNLPSVRSQTAPQVSYRHRSILFLQGMETPESHNFSLPILHF